MHEVNLQSKRFHISNTRIVIAVILLVLTLVGLTLPHVYAPPRPSAFNVTPSNNDVPWFDGLQDSCYASGLHWVFNDNGTGWHFWTSAKGSSWVTHTLALTAGRPYDVNTSFHCIGSSIYYVYGLGGSAFFYRFGSLNSNGTITWSIPESSVSTTGGSVAGESIIVDSSGNIWASVSSVQAGVAHVEVYEHTSVGWAKLDDLALTLPNQGPGSQLFALTSGKVADVYGNGSSAQKMNIKVYSGSWSSPQAASSLYTFSKTAGVAIGDTVYMAAGTVNQCDLATSTNGGAWTIKASVLGPLSIGYCTIQKDTGTDLVMFSANQNGGQVQFAVSNDDGATFGTPGTIVSDVNPTYIATGDFSDGNTFFAYWASGLLTGSTFNIRIGLVTIR
jgi:hypothetical protein